MGEIIRRKRLLRVRSWKERSIDFVWTSHRCDAGEFDAGNESAGVALDSIAAGFVVGLASRKIARDFFSRQHGEVHQRGLDESEPLGVGKANEGHTREDGVRAAG